MENKMFGMNDEVWPVEAVIIGGFAVVLDADLVGIPIRETKQPSRRSGWRRVTNQSPWNGLRVRKTQVFKGFQPGEHVVADVRKDGSIAAVRMWTYGVVVHRWKLRPLDLMKYADGLLEKDSSKKNQQTAREAYADGLGVAKAGQDWVSYANTQDPIAWLFGWLDGTEWADSSARSVFYRLEDESGWADRSARAKFYGAE